MKNSELVLTMYPPDICRDCGDYVPDGPCKKFEHCLDGNPDWKGSWGYRKRPKRAGVCLNCGCWDEGCPGEGRPPTASINYPMCSMGGIK